jgi:hypothetical protein
MAGGQAGYTLNRLFLPYAWKKSRRDALQSIFFLGSDERVKEIRS